MEFFRRTIAQIQTQLGKLSISERIAMTLLVVIVFIAIVWTVYAVGQREMVPLLNQSFDEAQRARIINKLEAWEEPYQLSGDRIMVAKTRHRALIAKLSYDEVLPEDTSAGWSSMLEDTDIWTPESVRENKKIIILQNELSATIEDYPGVAKAEVFINPGSKRRLMNIGPVATASVNVQMKPGGRPTRKLASAIAACVSAAVNNMKRQDVKVIADGKLIAVAAEGQELDSEYLELKASIEQHLRDKITSILPVLNALVQVDATPNITRTSVSERLFADEGKGSWNPKVDATGHAEESNTAEKTQEPGMMANVPDQSAPAAGTSQSQLLEDETQSNKPFAGETNTTKVTGPGGYNDITVAVSIPLAYFEELAKRETDSQDKPDPAAIQAVTDREIPKLKKLVMHSVGLKGDADEESVIVDTYWAGGLRLEKSELAASQNAATAAANTNTISGFASHYGKHIAVSTLAMISLFMVLMMVRKASGPTEITEEEAAMMMAGQKPVDVLSVDDSNFVDEEGGAAILAGMELEDDAVKSHQVLQQIREMVQESPEIASNLVNKWISQDS